MKNREGSLLVFIIILLSALTICVTGVWQSTVFSMRIAHKRQQYEQQYRATEGLLRYGIALCKNNETLFDSEANKQESTLQIPSWPSGDKQSHEGVLTIKTLQNQIVSLQAALVNKDKVVCQVSCLLKKEKVHEGAGNQTRFIIDAWTINPTA